MMFQGHCQHIQSLETETKDVYTSVCTKCEHQYKDCCCHCPVCRLPLTACHVDCRVDSEMLHYSPKAKTIILPRTVPPLASPATKEIPRTLGTLGFSPVDVIHVERKRAFFLKSQRSENRPNVNASLGFKNVGCDSVVDVNLQKPPPLINAVTSTGANQSVTNVGYLQIAENSHGNRDVANYRTPSLGMGQTNVQAPPRSRIFEPQAPMGRLLHMSALVGLDVSETVPWEVISRRELVPADADAFLSSEIGVNSMPRGGDVIISIDGSAVADVGSSAAVRGMLAGDEGQIKTVVVSRLGEMMEFRLLCNCSYPAVEFIRGPPHIVSTGRRCSE